MKKLFVVIACLMACGNLFAQKKYKISATVVDEHKQTLPFAMVKLIKALDTAQSKVLTTDLQGRFIIDSLHAGDYSLGISFVGYKTKAVPVKLVADVDLKLLQLEKSINQLNDVNVQALKPFVERQIDKTVINVEDSPVSAGTTALDVLEKAPGVMVDKQNDQILLRSKSGVHIMIDGKNNFLSGSDLSNYLANLSSSQISTIEIITNPSSKYDASGNAGIINIKLKKNKAFGTNGGASASYGYAIENRSPKNITRQELGFNLNHRVEKLNLFGSANYSRSGNFTNLVLDRVVTTSQLKSVFNQNFNKLFSGAQGYVKLGADYYLSKATTLGLMVDGRTSSRTLDNSSQTLIKEQNATGNADKSVDQLSDADTPNKNYNINFNLKHDLSKKGASISFDADYSGFSYTGLEQFYNSFYGVGRQLDSNSVYKNNSATHIDIYASKIDVTYPVSETVNLEAGLKSSYVKTNNDFLANKLIGDNWQNVVGQSNNFIYKEQVNSAYFNISKDWNVWKMQLGLRAEHTHANGILVTSYSAVKQNYLSVFPTLFISQKINKNSTLGYSYGRRIDRPNYQQLNPFNFYMDPYTIQQGNPYLKPQFTDNFSLSYNYKSAFSVSLNYSYTKDLILSSKTQQDDITRIVTVGQGNIGSGENYSIEVYFPLKVAKWWNMQNSLSGFYNRYTDNVIENGTYKAGKFSFDANVSNAFSLGKNWSAELNYWIRSPRVWGLEQSTAFQQSLNAGIQKSFLNKQLKVRASISDILDTNYWKGSVKYDNLDLVIANRQSNRRAILNVSYNFGNQNVKSSRDRKTAADDIKKRAN